MATLAHAKIRRNAKFEPSDPPLLAALFTNPAFAAIWLVVRIYLGWQWLTSGIAKFQNPAWAGSGQALQSFWAGAVAVPAQGKPAITFVWYRTFLSFMLGGGHYTWFSHLVMFGEVAIGLALITGSFVGIAASFGALMNLNFMLAGSASTNPVMLVLAILLMLAWKTAGHWGLDRWLLGVVQTPWQRGSWSAALLVLNRQHSA